MNKQIARLLWQLETTEDIERVRALRKELAEARRRFAEMRARKVIQRTERVIRTWRSE